MLDLIQKGKQGGPPRVVIYGQEGIGKSTFAASAPKPVFLPTEDGLGQIECDQFPFIKSYREFLQYLAAISTEEHDYQTLVVDSLDWLEKLIWADVCLQEKKINIEDIGYAKGYKFALTQWREVITAFDYIRNQKGMSIILVAHAKVEKFEDPENPTYDRYTLALHKSADAYVREWSDAVLFAAQKKRINKEDVGFNKVRATAVAIGAEGGERILRTVGSPACVAKNRYGITGDIPLSWEAFAEYLN